MSDPRNLDAFEAWLWRLDDAQLDKLQLAGLARAAAADGVGLPQLTVLTVISDQGSAFEALLSGAAATIRDARPVRDGGLLWTRLRRQDYLVGVWPTAGTGVYHLIGSAPVTDSRWRRVEESWLRAAAPRLSAVILNQDDFEAIGDALSEHGTVEVSRLTARVLEDHSSYARGWHSGHVRQRPSHREALRETADMQVRTLSMSLGDRLSIHLRRHAGATYYRGDYGLFTDLVLHRLANAAAERRQLLKGRRRERQAPVTETLTMALHPGAMADPDAREDLLGSIGHLRGIQTAVYHRNPYLHFAVTDYLDGSTFDVFVTDSDEVEVVPGFYSSVGSLARVTEAMGDALGMVSLQESAVPNVIPAEELFGIA